MIRVLKCGPIFKFWGAVFVIVSTLVMAPVIAQAQLFNSEKSRSYAGDSVQQAEIVEGPTSTPPPPPEEEPTEEEVMSDTQMETSYVKGAVGDIAQGAKIVARSCPPVSIKRLNGKTLVECYTNEKSKPASVFVEDPQILQTILQALSTRYLHYPHPFASVMGGIIPIKSTSDKMEYWFPDKFPSWVNNGHPDLVIHVEVLRNLVVGVDFYAPISNVRDKPTVEPWP